MQSFLSLREDQTVGWWGSSSTTGYITWDSGLSGWPGVELQPNNITCSWNCNEYRERYGRHTFYSFLADFLLQYKYSSVFNRYSHVAKDIQLREVRQLLCWPGAVLSFWLQELTQKSSTNSTIWGCCLWVDLLSIWNWCVRASLHRLCFRREGLWRYKPKDESVAAVHELTSNLEAAMFYCLFGGLACWTWS